MDIDVEIDSDVRVTAHDDTGAIIAVFTHWVEPDGTRVFSADYSDGFAEYRVTEAGVVANTTLAPDVLAARASAIGESLDLELGAAPQEGIGACGAGVVLTTAGLATANPWAVVSGIAMACTCLPLIFAGSPEGDVECPAW